jgi:ring-1,2-phenylacetyl-CoA epoxidase subunit PaaC
MNPLYNYLLKLADDSFIMGQRLSAWCGEGPYLEEDIALTNIALDELGQANNFYVYASRLLDDGKSEDDIAFLRYEHEYLNAHWVELPNEKITWGKLDITTPKFIVESDATICAPLMFSYILENS